MTVVSLSTAANALALGFALATLASCNSILGIERASLALDAGNEGGVAGDEAGSDPLTCENYCTLMDQTCTGENLEYKTKDVCLGLCMQYLLPGASQYYAYPTDTPDGGDSLGCRLWHAHAAADESPAEHCRHAGLLGTDKCGGPCEPFCRIVHAFCSDQSPPVDPYDGGVRECVSVCKDGPYSYDLTSGDLVDNTMMMIETGNTLNCRLWHLQTAYQLMLPMTHCPHTGEVSETCH